MCDKTKFYFSATSIFKFYLILLGGRQECTYMSHHFSPMNLAHFPCTGRDKNLCLAVVRCHKLILVYIKAQVPTLAPSPRMKSTSRR